MSTSKIHKLIEHDFFIDLEYHLSNVLGQLPQSRFDQVWCDGIVLEGNETEAGQLIFSKQEIHCKAWLGKGGQDIYRMVIKLGECSMSKFMSGRKLNNCFPAHSTDWIIIEPGTKQVTLTLY